MFNYSQDVEIGLAYKSDHSPIYFSFYANRNTPGRGLFRFPNFLVNSEGFKEELTEELKHFVHLNVDEVDPQERPSPSLLWDTMKAYIRTISVNFLRKMKRHKVEAQQEIIEAKDRAILIEKERDKQFTKVEEMTRLTKELNYAHAKLQEICHHYNRKELTRNIRKKNMFANTCSKYFFRKIKSIAGALRYVKDNGVILHKDEEILDHCVMFYDNLYGSSTVPKGTCSNFSDVPDTKMLDEQGIELMSTKITMDELGSAVESMKKLSAPGLDGLTVPFYQTFWPIVGKYVFESIEEAHVKGEFTIDQRRGLLKLIPKRNRDPGYVKNLRPITSLNVDYKMLTKVLANRMREIIPTLIHEDQKGFVHGRFLGETVIELQTLMTMAQNYEQGDEFVLMSLDIEKAFDTIDWSFMRRTLINFGFPPYFMQWIKTIQTEVELRIANNGHLSSPFKVFKGVAQGDSLSPYLFILMIETLATHVRNNKSIKGISDLEMEKKVAMVADDSLFILKCEKPSIQLFITVLKHFQSASGLKVNFDKSRLIALNEEASWVDWECVSQFKIVDYGETFSYLGAQLTAKETKTDSDPNFPFSKSLIQEVLKSRPIMTTCITGRILQVKSLVASKFVYLLQLLPTPNEKWFVNVDRLYYAHVWEGGRHRISKTKMIAPKNVGGFNMLDVRLQDRSLKLKWLDCLLSVNSNTSLWCVYIKSAFCIPIQHVLLCNNKYNVVLDKFLIKPIPQVWRDIFRIWISEHYIPIECASKKRREDLFNTLVCFSPVTAELFDFDEEFAVNELLVENNMVTWRGFQANYTEEWAISLPLYMSVLVATLKANIPEQWCFIFGTVNEQSEFPPSHRPDLCLDGTTTVKECYQWLVNNKFAINDFAITSWTVDLEIMGIRENWSGICSKLGAIKHPMLQDFARSFLHRSFYLNVQVAEFKPDFSENCTFCEMVPETYVHLYWECPMVQPLWNKVTKFITEHVLDEPEFTRDRCLLSNFDVKVLVVITVIVKYVIFISRINKWPVSYVRILDRICREKNNHLERTHPDRMNTFYDFWAGLISDKVFQDERQQYSDE